MHSKAVYVSYKQLSDIKKCEARGGYFCVSYGDDALTSWYVVILK